MLYLFNNPTKRLGMKFTKILLLDDDRAMADLLRTTLGPHFSIDPSYTVEQFFTRLRQATYDLGLIDLNIGDAPLGLDVIAKTHQLLPQMPILALSGYENFDWVRSALRQGAKDYVLKSRVHHELELAITRNVETLRIRQALHRTSQELNKSHEQIRFIGESRVAQSIREKLVRFRNTRANILITGETGTGKEVAARLLRRQDEAGNWEPFVAVDSSTIQSSLAESMLFGHEKGAFTGAERTVKGFFEEADGGTIYFDELANMPMDIQAKLLRVIQEKEIRTLGSNSTRKLEFRVITASNQDMEVLCAEGKFKYDLFQRLSVIPIELPPLRERMDDLPVLIEYFKVKNNLREYSLSQEAYQLLLQYPWPGNLRELQNLLAYLDTVTDAREIEICHLPPPLLQKVQRLRSTVSFAGQKHEADWSLRSGIQSQLDLTERVLIERALSTNQGNVTRTAQQLGMDRSNLYLKLKKHGMEASHFRGTYL